MATGHASRGDDRDDPRHRRRHSAHRRVQHCAAAPPHPRGDGTHGAARGPAHPALPLRLRGSLVPDHRPQRPDRRDCRGPRRGYGNYRWTTWTGTESGVAEQEQPFGVFGSYGAGDLAGMAYSGDSPVVLGAWQSDRTGLDIATWTRSGTRWVRQPSTDTPLGSTAEELLGATAITSGGDGLVLSGSVTRLEPGSVTVEPAMWTSPDADGPWTQAGLSHETPARGNALAEAHAATCAPHLCLVTGAVGGRFTLWEVRGNTTTNPPGKPTSR